MEPTTCKASEDDKPIAAYLRTFAFERRGNGEENGKSRPGVSVGKSIKKTSDRKHTTRENQVHINKKKSSSHN